MAVTVTFLGHSGFLFSDGKHAVAVDPFLTGNPVAKHKPSDVRCGTVALTHAQLAMLLEGIDWRRPQRTWQPQHAA